MDNDAFAYIMVTPAKNEETSLPVLINSIINQSIKPIVWFIIDDGSTDSTNKIISAYSASNPWIHCLTLENTTMYDIEEHYAYVCNTGFRQAIDYCEKNSINFNYVALSDADMIYPEDYFYSLITILRNNDKLGIISGNIHIKKDNAIYTESQVIKDVSQPRGTGRVWKKECFESTNGYMVTKSPDTVSNIIAITHGWDIKLEDSIICYQTRETGGKYNLFKGWSNRGKRSYYLGMNILTVFNTPISLIFVARQKHSITKSIAFLQGYFRSLIKGEKQIDNLEVKKYMGSYKNVLKNYYKFFRNKI